MEVVLDKNMTSDPLKQPEIPRRQLASLSEYYDDLWRVDTYFSMHKSMAMQGASLLQCKLKERESMVRRQCEHIARKRGIDPVDLWNAIVDGNPPKLTPEELKEINGDDIGVSE